MLSRAKGYSLFVIRALRFSGFGRVPNSTERSILPSYYGWLFRSDALPDLLCILLTSLAISSMTVVQCDGDTVKASLAKS